MSHSDLEQVYQAWQNDANFKEQFKKNPDAALNKLIENENLVLNNEELKAVHTLLLKLRNDEDSDQDEELDQRISK